MIWWEQKSSQSEFKASQAGVGEKRYFLPLWGGFCGGDGFPLAYISVKELREMGQYLEEDLRLGQGLGLILFSHWVLSWFPLALPSPTTYPWCIRWVDQMCPPPTHTHIHSYIHTLIYICIVLEYVHIYLYVVVLISVHWNQWHLDSIEAPFEKRLISDLNQRKDNMNLEHLVVPESKEVLRECWRHVKRTWGSLNGFPLASNDSNRL